MAIKFYAVKCPACGADLQSENGREISFCSFCGSKLMMNNENEYIYRSIDEARIKEAETARLIQLKKLEIEEAEKARRRKGLYIAYAVGLAFVLIGVLSVALGADGGVALVLIGVYVALFTLLFQFCSSKKNNNRCR